MQSATKRNKFEMMGQYILVCFNEQEVLPTDEDSEIHYQYDSAKLPICCERDEAINSVVKIRYKTFDKEIAAIINGGQDAQNHNEWRVAAKLIADEFITYRDNLLTKN